MNRGSLNVFDDPGRLAGNFANFLYALVQKPDTPSHIALSGGSTPRKLFDLLAKEYKARIPWERIHFYWSDERCVPPDDPDSNFGMTRTHLLDHISIPRTNIHRIHGEANPLKESVRYSAEIESNLPSADGLPVFDLVMLGLGEDGHTASIFPHELYLLDAPELCHLATHPETGQNRITMTGGLINNAKKVAFLVTGANKQHKLRMIHGEEQEAISLPAYHIKPAGELFWFVDKAAAGDLQ